VIRLSPSKILKYEDCPRAYYYQYVERLRTLATSSNLVFGTVAHKVLELFLQAWYAGKSFDPKVAFEERWEIATADQEIEYSSRFESNDLLLTGAALCSQIPEAWERSGLMLVADEKGPILERTLEVRIGDVVLVCKPDLLVMDLYGSVGPLDFKTPASASPEDFALVSDQLTAYQVAVDANRERLGTDPVAKVGFWEGIKRKVTGKGPKLNPPMLVPRRSPEDLLEFSQKVQLIGRDIAAERFHRRPRMAHNTPCGMCEYRGLCLEGSMEGLYQKPEPRLSNAA
jgi:hypothetical protein